MISTNNYDTCTMHRNIMNTRTIHDYHTVSNMRVYCLVNKANTTTVFRTKLFPLTVDTWENFLQKSLNDPITHSEVIRRNWWSAQESKAV